MSNVLLVQSVGRWMPVPVSVARIEIFGLNVYIEVYPKDMTFNSSAIFKTLAFTLHTDAAMTSLTAFLQEAFTEIKLYSSIRLSFLKCLTPSGCLIRSIFSNGLYRWVHCCHKLPADSRLNSTS